MKMIKALNNNVALVANGNVEEVIMGKGVAFNTSINGEVHTELIEKRFILETEDKKEKFAQLLNRINVEAIELASTIVKDGESYLSYKCNDSILLTLSDHLGLMLERAKSDLYFATQLQWDIQLIYPKEFTYSQEVIKWINESRGLNIPEQEAAFIALHFINASSRDREMEETILYTKIIQNILNIVKLHYSKELPENSFIVSRFITHIRYFVGRQINNQSFETDNDLVQMIADKSPKDFSCALKIAEFLYSKYGWEINKTEILYLTLHLNRINTNE